MDIVRVIKAQHQQVDKLLDQAAEEGTDTAVLLKQVAQLLIPHSEAEESFVYPAIRAKASDAGEEVQDGVAEHHQIQEMLKDLLRGEPGDAGYDGTLAAITGEFRHHVKEEEEELLPLLEQHSIAEEREEMGRRFATATTGTTEPPASELTREELYDQAKRQGVPDRSKMNKDELADAVDPDAKP
jgi:hemerythrin-like domain-containing protein